MAATGRATPPLLKRLNERTVLEAIRDGAPISRAEISRRAGISKPTVSLALQSLLDAGPRARGRARRRTGPSYGAVFFEPVPEAALVLGLDLGARFLRGAHLRPGRRRSARARTSSSPSAGRRRRARARSSALRAHAARGRPRSSRARSTASSSACPGVVAADGTLQLAENVPGLEGRRFAAELAGARSTCRSRSRTTSTSPRSASSGAASRAASTTSSSSRSAPASAPGSSSRGELHRGRHGAAGEIDFALGRRSARRRPVAPPRCRSSPATSRAARDDALRAPYDARAIFAAARAGDAVARAVVDEEARRIALHVAPIAAVADVELVVLGGGIGANGDLLLDPIARLLARVAAVPAAGRGLEPRRGRRAHRRARGRAPGRARERLRQTHRRYRPEPPRRAHSVVGPG